MPTAGGSSAELSDAAGAPGHAAVNPADAAGPLPPVDHRRSDDVASVDMPPLAAAAATAGWPLRRQLGTITFAWMFGAVWFNVTTGAPLTLLAKGLGASPAQFGILASLPYVAALLSVAGSLLVERTGNRKRVFLDAHYAQRSLTLVVAVAPLLLLHWYGPAAAPRAVTLLLALVFLMHASGATGGPAWVSWMADVVPARVRGAYFARRRQWGILTAVPAALLVGLGLDRLVAAGASHAADGTAGGPLLANVPAIVLGCSALFAVVAFFGLVDIACFQNIPHAPKPPRRGSELLRAMVAPLRDKPFLAMSGFVGAMNFTVGFTNQFATLYVIDRLKVDNVHAQLLLLVAPMALQLVMLPAWGAAVDKVGKKPLMVVAAAGLVPMAFGWCLMGRGQALLGADTTWLAYLLFAGGTVLWTGVDVANFNAVVDHTRGRHGAGGHGAGGHGGPSRVGGGSGYHAVNTVIINLAGCGGGLAAGLVAHGLREWHWQVPFGGRPADFYDALFALSGTVRLAALLLLAPLLHEPAAKSARYALRFMARHTLDRATTKAAAAAAWWGQRADEAAAALPAAAQPQPASAEG
jgi:Na+/melibiose symporter-like transporter